MTDFDKAPAETALARAPTTMLEVGALRQQIEAYTAGAEQWQIVTAEDYTRADAVLTEVCRWLDEVTAMRQEGTLPLYRVAKTIEGWFRPLTDPLERVSKHLRAQIGAYRLRQAEEADAARAEAVAALTAGDDTTTVQALTRADALSTPPADTGARVRFRWVVDAIDPAALPREYWTPNVDLLNMHASTSKGDTPPDPIPGVTFKRQPIVGAKRK